MSLNITYQGIHKKRVNINSYFHCGPPWLWVIFAGDNMTKEIQIKANFLFVINILTPKGNNRKVRQLKFYGYM